MGNRLITQLIKFFTEDSSSIPRTHHKQSKCRAMEPSCHKQLCLVMESSHHNPSKPRVMEPQSPQPIKCIVIESGHHNQSKSRVMEPITTTNQNLE